MRQIVFMKKATPEGNLAGIREQLGLGVPVRRIAQDHGTTPANLHRWLRMHRIGKAGTIIEETGAGE